VADAEELARRERKREARRLREAEEAAAQEDDAEEAPAAETEEERRERKRKRKEAKRAAAAQAGAAPPEQAVKRSKAVGGASARGVCAKVGDHEAAAKGAPIAKSFYNECDELAALSTAVRARSRGQRRRRGAAWRALC